MFRKIKIDINDRLYSKIIRFGKTRCDRCHLWRSLDCAHIMGRGNYTTRFMLHPVRNAVALCTTCHGWFDTHKIVELLRDPAKRVFGFQDESFTWLVKSHLRYTWDDLTRLYVLSNAVSSMSYGRMKSAITTELKSVLAKLESE